MSEHQQIQQSRKPDSTFQKQATPVNQNTVSHPASIIQRARINPKSLTPADVMQLQRTIGNRAVGRLLSEIRNPSTVQQATVQRQEIPEEEESLQGKMIETIQRQEIPEEEEPLQGKFESKPEEICPSCTQRQEIPEEEEPLQGKFETIQRLEPEDEEKLQMKSVVQRQEIPEEEEPLQGKMAESVQRQEIPEEEEPLEGKMIGTVQRQEILEEEEPLQPKRENNTGIPDDLKAGVESLSGIDISDVRVHYNSDKPARVGALAYTQETNIHVAPGQERHLPHEAWHVVQQVQGRVQPTMQLKGVAINDDVELEREADVMGEKAMQEFKDFTNENKNSLPEKIKERKVSKKEHVIKRATNVIQRSMGMEFETSVVVKGKNNEDLGYQQEVFVSDDKLWKITIDGITPENSKQGVLEFVTEPIDKKETLENIITEIHKFIIHTTDLLTKNKKPQDLETILSESKIKGKYGAFSIGEGFEESMFRATPQMTVGVPLERMASLIAESRKKELKEYQTAGIATEPEYLSYNQTSDKYFIGSDRAEIDPVMEAVKWGENLKNEHKEHSDGIDKAVGLMSLVLHYLNAGYFKSPAGLPPYAKCYFPIMARTNFAAMYQSIGKGKEYFNVDEVLKLWKCTQKMAKETPVFKYGFEDKSGKVEGPSVYNWLDSIINPRPKSDSDIKLASLTGQSLGAIRKKDLLSRGEVAYNSVSMGRLEMDRDLAVVEFRQFPPGKDKSLGSEHWKSLAVSLFEFTEGVKKKKEMDQKEAYKFKVSDFELVSESISNIYSELAKMKDTQDENFNSKVRNAEKELKIETDKKTPDEIKEIIKKYVKTISELRQTYNTLKKTSAPEYPAASFDERIMELEKLERFEDFKSLLHKIREDIAKQVQGYTQLGDEEFKSKVKSDANDLVKELRKLLDDFEQSSKEVMSRKLNEFKIKYLKKVDSLREEFFKLEDKGKTTLEPMKQMIGKAGNCLFDSVSYMINRDCSISSRLRQETANEVRNNPLIYIPYLVGDYNDIMEIMLIMADSIAEDGNWNNEAGELAPHALANTPDVKSKGLVILNMDKSVRARLGNVGQNSIYIFYNGENHYTPSSQPP